MTLQEKIKAPDFTLLNEKGEKTSLSDFIGQPVVLYFYPKDETPGCTTEACSFRDDYSKYKELGAVILGVSPDSEKSHAKFADKHQLPFTLLVDENHKVCDLYQVWGRKKFMGREFDGVFRTTYLIDSKGLIAKVFEGVKPASHSDEVLAALASL
jgi:peroxiredoxin Q/BCP